jgi:hypothetical protein
MPPPTHRKQENSLLLPSLPRPAKEAERSTKTASRVSRGRQQHLKCRKRGFPFMSACNHFLHGSVAEADEAEMVDVMPKLLDRRKPPPL